jgi:putative transposase
MRRPYPTDLSDAEWTYIEPHLPAPEGLGRPRTRDLREILNAVFYVLRSGCQWRLLPHDFPRWPTVYWYFRKWRIDGTWERINRALRERLRVRLKRDPQPTAGIVDSQSVKTTGVGERSAVMMVARRSRAASVHLLVDTQGLVLRARVHSSAKVMDRDGIKTLLEAARYGFPRLSHLWLDAAAYNGREKGADWVEKVLGWSAEIVRHPRKLAPEEVMKIWAREWAKEGVIVDWKRLLPEEGPRPFLPKRWIVERSLAWICHNRRMSKDYEGMSKDYERLCATGEAFVYAAMARLMVGRLART